MTSLVSNRYGKLIVISFSHRQKSAYYWNCACDCGNYKTINAQSMKRGATQSCGCIQKAVMTRRLSTHNGTYTKTYTIWQDMKRRCENPQRKDYKYYGGRGIQNKLKSHEDILTAIGPWPGKGYSLDRINNNGHYEAGNLRWATQSQQRQNSRYLGR